MPTKIAERRVNTYACRRATKPSMIIMKTDIPTTKGETAKPTVALLCCPKKNIRPRKDKRTKWPPVMFAIKRIVRAKGLIIQPNTSSTNNIGTKARGTPEGTRLNQNLIGPCTNMPPTTIRISVIVDKPAAV